ALLGGGLRRRRLCSRSLGIRLDRGARLADGVRFRLGRFLRRSLLHRFGGFRLVGFRLVWLSFGLFGILGLGCLHCLLCSLLGFRLAAALVSSLGRALVDQRDGFRQRDRVLFLVARDRRVDAARGDIGAVTAALDGDCAERGMIAELLAGIGAEAAAARTLGNLFRDQRHGAIEADIEHFVTGL